MILPVKNTQGELEAKQVHSAYDFDDEAALKLVVQDAARADGFLTEKQWSMQWREADVLYQSPRGISGWEGTTVSRANVSRFTVAKHVNSVVPQMFNGVFSEDVPFILRPRPGTSQKITRAKTSVLSSVLDDIDFKPEVEQFLFSKALMGTGIAKWGWQRKKTIVRRYVRKAAPIPIDLPLGGKVHIPTTESDDFKVIEEDHWIERPWFENKDITTIKVDPAWKVPDIRKAKWVIDESYLTFNDLNELRDDPSYTIPSEAELKALFFTPKETPAAPGNAQAISQGSGAYLQQAAPANQAHTADPLEQPLLVQERVDGYKVIAVLNKKLVIRNEVNPFGCINYYSANYWNVRNAGHGIGIGRMVGQDQRVEQGSMNAAIDILSMASNPSYARARGANVPTQQIRTRLGGIIDVDGDVDKAFRLVETPKVPPEIWTAIQVSKSESESASGADQMLQQGNTTGGRTSMGRTAGGAGILAAANASRLQGPLDRFINQVFVPWLYQMDQLINERMPISDIREILGEEMGDDYAHEIDMEEFLNAKFKYDVLAGAKLAAKAAMAQALPLMIQIFLNPEISQQLQIEGKKVSIEELLDMFMEVSEWKNQNDIIVPMTKEDLSRMMMMNPGAQKMQAQAQAEDQKFHNKQELQDQNNTFRAANEVLKMTMEQAMTPVALTGEPGGKGFGAPA